MSDNKLTALVRTLINQWGLEALLQAVEDHLYRQTQAYPEEEYIFKLWYNINKTRAEYQARYDDEEN